MPVDGHPPHVPRIGLVICTPCRVGLHEQCGPVWDAARRRVLYCECAFDTYTGEPCLPRRRP